ISCFTKLHTCHSIFRKVSRYTIPTRQSTASCLRTLTPLPPAPTRTHTPDGKRACHQEVLQKLLADSRRLLRRPPATSRYETAHFRYTSYSLVCSGGNCRKLRDHLQFV